MLNIIGLGLGDAKDITIKGLELVQSSDHIYLESYTSALQCSLQELEELYKKNVHLTKREDIENNMDLFLEKAKTGNISLLIIGDPLAATTHLALLQRARELNIKVNIIHNASIFTAIAETGLSLYNFGKVASIPFHNQDVETPYNLLKENKHTHTLLLLDLQGHKYMNVKEAVNYLLSIEQKRKESLLNENTLCIACAALGTKNQKIEARKAKDIQDLKVYPQCLIIPGKMQFFEEEFLQKFMP